MARRYIGTLLLLVAVHLVDSFVDQGLGDLATDDAYSLFHREALTSSTPISEPGTALLIDCTYEKTLVQAFDWTSTTETRPLRQVYEPGFMNYAFDQDRMMELVNEITSLVKSHFAADKLESMSVMIVSSDERDDKYLKSVAMRFIATLKQLDVRVILRKEVRELLRDGKQARQVSASRVAGRPAAYGVIEMDNSSLVLSYELLKDMETEMVLYLDSSRARDAFFRIARAAPGGKLFSRHSIKFEGLGSASAYETYLNLIVDDHMSANRDNSVNGDMLVLEDPCAPMGYLSEPRRKSCGNSGVSERRPAKAELYEGKCGLTYATRGTGSYSECVKIVNRLPEEIRKLGAGRSAFGSCNTDLLTEKFVPYKTLGLLALGQIRSITEAILGSYRVYDHKEMAIETERICETPLSNATDLKLCFKAVWLDTVLIKALRMPEDFDRLRTDITLKGRNLHDDISAVRDIW